MKTKERMIQESITLKKMITIGGKNMHGESLD